MSEPFDFEAFISGAKLAEDTFDLYLVNHTPAIARLRQKIEQATAGGDEREGTIPADVSALEQQVERLSSEMRESRREFTLRALAPAEVESLGSNETDIYDQLAIQSVKPALDRDQWKRVGAAAGARQFNEFITKANRLAAAEVVVPDFSPSTSTTQDLRESSLS